MDEPDLATQPSTVPQQVGQYESSNQEDENVLCTLVCLTGNIKNVVLRMDETTIGIDGKSATKKEWIFGRNSRCDVYLGEIKRVSNHHFRIWTRDPPPNTNEPPIVLIEDVSTNGTYLNQSRLPRKRSCILTQGDEVGLGMGVPQDEIRFLMNFGPAFLRGRQQQVQENTLETGIYGRYDMRDTIGKGAFATVRKAVDRATGEVFAVKVIPRRRIMAGLAVKREVEILMRLNHPHIVKLKELFEDRSNVYLVMEYVAGGDLMDYITKHGAMKDNIARTVVKQVLQAVAYVHSAGISHRDIKPDNILVVSEDEPDGKPIQIKVSDFGLAKISESGTFLKTFCGTLAYLAPEVIKARDSSSRAHPERTSTYYSNKVDMWSIGCMVYVLLTGYLPFNGSTQEQLCNQIMAGEYSQQPLDEAKVSADAKSFIGTLLEVDPKKRPTAKLALLLNWLRDGPQPAVPTLVSEDDDKGLERKLDDDDDAMEGVEEVAPGHASDIDSSDLQKRTAKLEISRARSISGHARTSLIEPHGEVGNEDKIKIDSIGQQPIATGVRDYADDNDLCSSSIGELPPKTWLMLETMKDSIPYKDIMISREQVWFGRAPRCEVRLTDSRTSKLHCYLRRKRNSNDSDTIYLSDFSTNGCFVNNQRVGSGMQATLMDGDEIAIFKERTEKLAFKVQLVRPQEFRVLERVHGVVEIVQTPVQKNDLAGKRKKHPQDYDDAELKLQKKRSMLV
ncbi:kinase-like domain-containing protein [Lipomyces orientalis]|uniref:Kinase-like domain-containing protein n=1 Tax=Lipomyces orientalis TaxID=1233043 RepID=A0ACC3TP60_9ASCO